MRFATGLTLTGILAAVAASATATGTATRQRAHGSDARSGSGGSMGRSHRRASKEEVDRILRSGRFDRQRLLQNAVPYTDSNGERMLEQQNGDADNNGFQLTGQMSVKFNSCRSVSVQDDNLLQEDIVSLAMAGEVVSQRSYVVVDLCTNPLGCQDDEYHQYLRTYMVDLETFVTATLDFMPNQAEAYCEGCNDNYYFCANVDYKSTSASGLTYFYKGDKYEIIDCAACSNLGCFNQYGDKYEQNGWDEVSNYVQEMACMALDNGYQTYTNGAYEQIEQVYAGWMCDGDGESFEIGVFADDACTLYVPSASYIKYVQDGSETWTYLYKAQEALDFMFTNTYDCFGGEVQYVNDYQEVYGDDPCNLNQYGQYNDIDECNQQMEEMYEAVGEVCEGLASDEAVSLETCYIADDNNNNNNGNDNSNVWSYFKYTSFDIDEDDQYSESAICNLIQQDVVTGNDFKNVYDESRSGSVYDGTSSTNFFPSIPDAKTMRQAAVNPSRVHPATFVGIAFIVAALFFGIFYFVRTQDDKPVDPEIVEIKEDYVLA